MEALSQAKPSVPPASVPQASAPPASDIYTCITPVFYVHKALGLACFSLRKENNSTTVQYSSRGAVYNLCVIALALVVIVLANLGNSSHSYQNMSFVTHMNDVVQTNIPLFLMLVALISARNQKQIIKSIKRLNEVDYLFGNINVDVPHIKNHTFLIYQLITVSSVLVAMICINDVTMAMAMEMDFLWSLLMGLSTAKFISYTFESQFIAWLFALRQRFKLINKRMRDPSPVDGALVQAFAAAHSALCDVSEQVNSVFSVQMLTSATHCFLDIMMNLFYCVRAVIINSNGGHESMYIIVYVIYLTVWPIFKNFLVCFICSATRNEARMSGSIVHDNMSRNNQCPVARKELKRFSLQLLHQRVCLTAYGFFTLDFSLVHSIVITVTTYIIILLQFDKEALTPQLHNNVTLESS